MAQFCLHSITQYSVCCHYDIFIFIYLGTFCFRRLTVFAIVKMLANQIKEGTEVQNFNVTTILTVKEVVVSC